MGRECLGRVAPPCGLQPGVLPRGSDAKKGIFYLYPAGFGSWAGVHCHNLPRSLPAPHKHGSNHIQCIACS